MARNRNSPRKQTRGQRTALHGALWSLQDALTKSGLDRNKSLEYARLILSRPGVRIGRQAVRYKGKRYKSADLATSPLAQWITGRAAELKNKAAIEGEPGYLSELASLGLQQELTTSPLEEQRRRSILEFGDPRFAGSDTLLASEAGANPYSTALLLERDRQRRLAETETASARAGTLFGGGWKQGQAEVARVSGAQQFEATRNLEDLLGSLERQRAEAGSIYSLGKSNALQSATQRLTEAGVIHAAGAPKLKARPYSFVFGNRRRRNPYGPKPMVSH